MLYEQKQDKNIPLITIVIAVALLVLGGWYYVAFNPNKGGEIDTLVMVEEKQAPQKLVVAFGMQNNSGQIGNAVFHERDGKVFVEVDVFNAPKDTPQPAHVHEGSCPNPGAVKYSLTSVVNGQSETTLDVSLEDILASLPLSVNVHKSTKEAGTYVSCGIISRETLTAE